MKIAILFLLGLTLAGQGFFALTEQAVASESELDFCATGCDLQNCPTAPCCVRRAERDTAPQSVPVRSTTEKEWQAIAVKKTGAPIIFPAQMADKPFSGSRFPSALAAVSIFKRDCAYLL